MMRHRENFRPYYRCGSGWIGSCVAVRAPRGSGRTLGMRPVRSTPAHQTADFAELVCSNSLKSDSENTAPWLLKEEMRRAGSRLIEIARECAVPAGHALAVDRAIFRAKVTEAISPRTADQHSPRRSHRNRRSQISRLSRPGR